MFSRIRASTSSSPPNPLPRPKILNCLRLFYALYLPIATIALAISIFLCLPLYNSILLGTVDATQIGYNDMDSKLFSRQTNVILLLTHHSLYLLQILIGLIGLLIGSGQIYFWIIYVTLATCNGFLLLIFTLSGLVFFALPVIFSIIDISNSCYMCFILEAYTKNNLIYIKSLTESSYNLHMSNTKDSTGGVNLSASPTTNTSPSFASSVNEIDSIDYINRKEGQKRSLVDVESAIELSMEINNKTNEASIDAGADGDKRMLNSNENVIGENSLNSKLNYVTYEAKLGGCSSTTDSHHSNESNLASASVAGLNECFYVDKSQINLNGSQITSSEEKIELQETSKLPSSDSFKRPNENESNFSTHKINTRVKSDTKINSSINITNEIEDEDAQTKGEIINIQSVNYERDNNNLTPIVTAIYSGPSPASTNSPGGESSSSINISITRGVSEEYLNSLSSNDLYFSSANSLESLNKVSPSSANLASGESGPGGFKSPKKPEIVINSLVKDAAIASSAV